MANQYINAMTAIWNSVGTTYAGIKMNVTNAASAAGSMLLQLQVGTIDKFTVDKTGNVVTAGTITASGITTGAAMAPLANDGAALGSAALSWSDLYLASGGVINWLAGDVTISHASNLLSFAGATGGYTFDAPIQPVTHDFTSLGTSAVSWSDLYLGSGGVINWAASDVTLTHSADILTVGGGDLRMAVAGTNAASVVTVGGTQTLTAKTLTTPVVGTNLSIQNGAKTIGLRVTAAGTLEIFTGATVLLSITETGNLTVLGTSRLTGNVVGLGNIQANGDVEAFAGVP
jgi:hypothetical protein